MLRIGLLCLAIHLLPVYSAAAPPEPASEAAERLHAKAVAEAKQGLWPQAIQDWEAASALHATWKYALNLASAYAFRKEWMTAWEALDRAKGLGLPTDRQQAWQLLRDQVEAELLKTQAWVELTVEPAGALVERGGQPWPPPHRGWVRSPATALTVRAAGHDEVKRSWDHPVGGRYPLTVRLVPHAAVPLAKVPSRVEELEAGRESRPIEPALMATPKAESLTVWKWSLAGSAIATIAVGAGLIGWSEQLSSDAADLNANPQDRNTYDAEYDRLDQRYRALRAAGWTLTGVGAALAAAGAVIFILDALDQNEAPRVSVTPMVAPGIGGVSGSVTF